MSEMNWIDFDKQQPDDGQWCFFVAMCDSFFEEAAPYSGIGVYDKENARFVNNFCDPIHTLYDDEIEYWMPYPEPECPLDRKNWPTIDELGSRRLNTHRDEDNATQPD